MEWVLIISLFSTQDVLMKEHSTYKECVTELKQFKKMHKDDANIRSIECNQAFIVDGEVIVTKRIPDL